MASPLKESFHDLSMYENYLTRTLDYNSEPGKKAGVGQKLYNFFAILAGNLLRLAGSVRYGALITNESALSEMHKNITSLKGHPTEANFYENVASIKQLCSHMAQKNVKVDSKEWRKLTQINLELLDLVLVHELKFHRMDFDQIVEKYIKTTVSVSNSDLAKNLTVKQVIHLLKDYDYLKLHMHKLIEHVDLHPSDPNLSYDKKLIEKYQAASIFLVESLRLRFEALDENKISREFTPIHLDTIAKTLLEQNKKLDDWIAIEDKKEGNGFCFQFLLYEKNSILYLLSRLDCSCNNPSLHKGGPYDQSEHYDDRLVKRFEKMKAIDEMYS